MTVSEPSKSEVRDGLCGICPAGCWVRIALEDGRISRVEALPDHPLGMICAIGARSPAVVYDPDRLRHPLRRVGPKGSHDFERIGWDEAYEIIVDAMEGLKEQHGPESVAMYTGRGSFDMALCDLFQPADAAVSSASSVLFPFGSPNTLGVGALCYVSFAMIAPHTTLGEMLTTMDVDIEQAELIVLWGANPITDSPPLVHRRILEARARGAEVVCIDPRRNGTARQVEAEWIPVRPGTDGALALSLIEVLIEEELYDEDFVRDWTQGFEELAQLTQHFRPEVVEGITGVPADTVRSLARRIASSCGACPVMYTGLEYSDSGVQAIRAVLTLWALAGMLDVPGGLVIRMKENLFPQNRRHLIANPAPKRALGRDRFPVYSAYRGESHAAALPAAVLDGDPYPVRALLVLGASMITSWPSPELWKKTLAGLDFLVCIDRYHTADSAYADIVLPATTQYETTSFMRYGPLFKIRERIIEPVGEARNDFLILAELARRLGYGELYPQTEEDILRWALEGSGQSLEEVRRAGGELRRPSVLMQYKKWEKGKLRADGEPGFDTPSGKFEIASSLLREHGYDALPVYTEPHEGPLSRPELAERYPLVFNSGTRTAWEFRSQHHGVEGLREHAPEPNVILHPADAAERGIADGDPVWVESPRGRVPYRARLSSDIVRGAVDAQMGGGGPLGPRAWRECNVNELTDPLRYDPISGFPVYKALLCDVRRAQGPARRRKAPAPSEAPPDGGTHEPSASVRQVYLDHNATTPVLPEVLAAMLPFLQNECGNPSSIHQRGSRARVAVENARRQIAQALGCTARRVVFTGSGSEADNLAILGTARTAPLDRRHLIVSAVEHPAVSRVGRALQAQGFELSVLPVDRSGLVSVPTLEEALRPDTLLVSIMTANNEVGTIQPISELAQLARSHGALFHTDAVQAFGKVLIDVDELGVDLLSISAHKLHGPKGIGALYLRRGIELAPQVHGGGQERNLRSGTENVASAVGFGEACTRSQRRLRGGEMERVASLRNRLQEGMLGLFDGAVVNGHLDRRLPNTLSMTLPGVRGESLVLLLDRRGVYFSSGSACKSGNPAPSESLLAMGLSEEQAHCTVRFSLGLGNQPADVDYTLEAMERAVAESSSTVRFAGCR
jgi:cysteine desulfurase NifS